MASVRTRLEESSIEDDDDSSSMVAYTTFNSLTAEDSVEQIRRRNVDINGDPAYYQCTDSEMEDSEQPACLGMFKSCCYKCIDVTVTVVVIILVWMIMAAPTGLYAYTVLNVSTKPSCLTE